MELLSELNAGGSQNVNAWPGRLAMFYWHLHRYARALGACGRIRAFLFNRHSWPRLPCAVVSAS